MSFSTRYMFAVLLVILGLPIAVVAQSTTRQTTKTPAGSVSGRVTIKDKGAPGVAVGLRKSEPVSFDRAFSKAVTDQDGFYRITNVPPGSYQIVASAPAFVTDLRGKTVIVGEDENVENINFSLIRGGVITGKVTDAEGRPAIQQQVNLFQTAILDRQGPERQVFAMTGAQTDDRGIYRMFGISPGRYKVATGRGDDTFSGNFIPTRTSYRQVFHPDVTEHTKATIIEVSEGSETNNVDIKLGAAMQTFSVSGRLIDTEKGLPVPNVRFGLQRLAGQRPEFTNTSVASGAQGEFFVEGLVPGKYGIFMFQNISNELRADSVTFEIIDQDLADVVIKLSKGASLSGVVVLDGEDKALFQKLLQYNLRAFVTSQGTTGFGQSSMSPIAPDGSFRLPGLPGGTANISLGSTGPIQVKGFAITRIERDGVVMPRGVEVKEGEHVTGLRVFVAFGNATIRGVVKLENGSLPPGVMLFVRVSKPGEMAPGGIRPTQVDARGHFLIEGIPTGDYDLTVMVPVVNGSRPRQVKQGVSVQNGVTTDVVITVDLSSPPPKP